MAELDGNNETRVAPEPNGEPPFTFGYRNHRGLKAVRHVKPYSLDYVRKPAYGYAAGWFIYAWDWDKNDWRSFALTNILIPAGKAPIEFLSLIGGLPGEPKTADHTSLAPLVSEWLAKYNNAPDDDLEAIASNEADGLTLERVLAGYIFTNRHRGFFVSGSERELIEAMRKLEPGSGVTINVVAGSGGFVAEVEPPAKPEEDKGGTLWR